jgi:hypothetical protein
VSDIVENDLSTTESASPAADNYCDFVIFVVRAISIVTSRCHCSAAKHIIHQVVVLPIGIRAFTFFSKESPERIGDFGAEQRLA